MLINTVSGKVISITIEEYLSMTDEDYNELVHSDYGNYINDPFNFDEPENKD